MRQLDHLEMKSFCNLQIRVTARKKFYKSAIQALQQISSHFNPTSKLAALADTFTEIGTVSSSPYCYYILTFYTTLSFFSGSGVFHQKC